MTPLSSLVAITWVASLWQGAALAMLAAVVLRLMPRATAAVRHGLLLTVFTVALVLPLLPVHTENVASAHGGLRLMPWVALAIATTWVAASLLRAAGLLHAWRHLRRVRAAAVPISTDTLVAGDRRAMLCASDDVSSPAVLGFFRPVLLLPSWMVPTLSADELRNIALHECEHLRRRDDWINLLLQLALVLMPLNPALLWLNRRVATERELACDAAVVAATTKPLLYAAALTKMAEQRMKRRTMRLALAALGRESELSQRVHALLREPAVRWTRGQSAVAMAAVAAVLLTVSTGMARAPRFVSVAAGMPAASVTATREAAPVISHVPGVTMLPASFEVKPAKKTMHRVARRIARAADVAVPAAALRPAFVRTASRGSVMIEDAVQYDSRPAHRVTTEFVPAYVAVPVSNGWLLIAL